MIGNWISTFHAWCTLWVVFPMVVLLGCYFMRQLGCLQITQLKRAFSVLLQKGDGEGSISRFGALSAVLAGNFGTGNISGMAVALSTGGPGALVWMWVMVFFGSIIQYASCLLGALFRTKDASGAYVGGPMYYLRDGLGYHKTAACFAVCTLFGALTVGNLAQVHSIVLPLENIGIASIWGSLCLAFFVAAVVCGGIQRLAAFASFAVPIKAILYLGTALCIIVLHIDQVPAALQIMFREAFGLSALGGGALGAAMFAALTTGFDRGLFATDAGTGIVPILQAGARSKEPVLDGIATLVAPLMVMCVCTVTGLVLLVTGAWQENGLYSTHMVTHAFSVGLGSPIGGYIVLIALVLFAYTTLLAWAYCGEKAIEFLFGTRSIFYFRLGYIAAVPLGTYLSLELVWKLADMAITSMLLMNVVGIVGLRLLVVQTTKRFFLVSQEDKVVSGSSLIGTN